MQVIIFPNDNGGVSIITPATNMDINEVAAKDVPDSKPFEIVDDATLPWDKPRETWEWI